MKRLTAAKTRIAPVLNGRLVAQEGLNPSYIVAPSGIRLSRVRVLATVVDKYLSESGKFASITLDDGTGTLRSKVFTAVSMFDNVNVGDLVDVVGKLREYGGEIYIQTELVTKMNDPNWETLRELDIRLQEKSWELLRQKVLDYEKQVSDMEELKRVLKEREGINEEDVESIVTSHGEETKESGKDVRDKVLALLDELDKGEGCDYSELIEVSGMKEDVIDAAVNELLEDGICFEPRPGKIKKL